MNQTKKYKELKNLYLFLDIFVTLLPLLVYIGMAIANNNAVVQKVGLSLSLITALIFVILNIMLKLNIRSTIWIVLIGIHCCIENIMPLIFMLAISSLLSEFVFAPLYKKYKEKFIINKEIDKRG